MRGWQRSSRSVFPWPASIRVFAVALASLALAVIPIVPSSVPTAAAQVQGATISAIVDNPTAYVGQTVTVTGAVEENLGPRSFLLEDDDFLSDDTIPVVAGRPILNRAGQAVDPSIFGENSILVTGTVHIFNLEAFEDRLGVDLDDDDWAEFAGRPVIIATSIRPWFTPVTP